MSIHTALGFAKQAISMEDLYARYLRRRGVRDRIFASAAEATTKGKRVRVDAAARAEQDGLRLADTARSESGWLKKVNPKTEALPKGERDGGEVSGRIYGRDKGAAEKQAILMPGLAKARKGAIMGQVAKSPDSFKGGVGTIRRAQSLKVEGSAHPISSAASNKNWNAAAHVENSENRFNRVKRVEALRGSR